MSRTDTVETMVLIVILPRAFSILGSSQLQTYSVFANSKLHPPQEHSTDTFPTTYIVKKENIALVRALVVVDHNHKSSSTMQTLPSDEQLRDQIKELLPTVDLRVCGINKFVKLLSKKLGGVNLKPRSAFIKEALTQAINSMANEDEQSGEEEEQSAEESDEEEAVTTPKKKGGGGLTAPKEISDDLAAFLGKGKTMSRTEIVKMLWAYVREHDLQDPENKREIILDSAMKKVFGCKQFSMFTMNKYISAHVHPFKPVDLTTNTTPKKRKTPSSKSSEKKKRKTGTQPPYRLSEAMVNILGKEILPRPQVVSGLWEYIKANDLQNPSDKREILCDDKLKLIFSGKKKVRLGLGKFCWTVHRCKAKL
jgi:upstream activation factor subunit UAF30